MALYNTVMQNEKIAIIALGLIIFGALSVFLVATYSEEILNSLFPEEKTIEFGDCADVNYIGKFENGTVFDSSYAFPDNKTDGTPLKIFVTMNKSEAPPTEYAQYSSGIIDGFMEGLVGLKEGETATIGPIPPEKAYGVTPKVGDVIDLSSIPEAGDIGFRILDVQENVPLPPEYEEFIPSYGFKEITTIYVLRDESHFVGKIINKYFKDSASPPTPLWVNATVVTKINETLLWLYTTPDEEKYENFTWMYSNLEEITNVDEMYQIFYPEETTSITSINDTAFNITHNPAINDSIMYYDNANSYGLDYKVDELTEDKIITYVNDGSSVENRTIREFDRVQTIQRNNTQKIVVSYPAEYLELALLSYLRSFDSSIIYSTAELADQILYFEVEIVTVYKTS